MNYLEIEPTLIHLQGISRSSSFKLTNKNEFLAVSFSISLLVNAANTITVFPQKGILLGGEEQKVRVKVAHDEKQCLDEAEVKYSVVVKFTYRTQYNKRYLIKNNMSGWDQLAKDLFQKEVVIVSAGQKQAIHDYIKQQIDFERKFGTEELSLSAIQQLRSPLQMDNHSFTDLDISSRAEGRQEKLLEGRPTQLNSSLQLDNIVPLDFGESRTQQEALVKKAEPLQWQQAEHMVESNIIPDDLSKSFQISMKSAHKNSFPESSRLNKLSQDAPKYKTVDLIILAVISAFFVALGSNIKRVLAYQ